MSQSADARLMLKNIRLVFLTANMPFGRGEEFLIEELESVRLSRIKFVVYPRNSFAPSLNSDARRLEAMTLRSSLISMRGLTSLFRLLRIHPRRFMRVLRTVLTDSEGFANTVRNLVVLPKASELAAMIDAPQETHLHAYWASTVATIAYAAAELSGASWSFSCHRSDIKRGNMLRAKVRSARFVRTISQSGRDWLIEKTGAAAKKIHVLHLGVNCQLTEARGKRAAFEPFVFVTPASLLPVKGHRYLLEACRILAEQRADFRVVLYGDGALKQEILSLIQRDSLQHVVTMAGRVDHRDLMQLYGDGKIGCVVLPSVTTVTGEFEGIPVCLMEAMAYAIPVIATNCGATHELVDHETGIVVAERDSEGLARSMRTIMQSPETCAHIGKNGQAKVFRQFNAAKNSSRLIELINGRDPIWRR